jgi:hypothetical protein
MNRPAPAKAVLSRFKDDMVAFSKYANESPVVRIVHLADTQVLAFFSGNEDAEHELKQALKSVKKLIKLLHSVKDADYKMVQDTIPLLEHAVNFVTMKDDDKPHVKAQKLRYLLNRHAGQNALIWTEFLFGVLISTKGNEDLRKLNPFWDDDVVMNLTSLSMLPANRLGHTNRCIGTAIALEKMSETV